MRGILFILRFNLMLHIFLCTTDIIGMSFYPVIMTHHSHTHVFPCVVWQAQHALWRCGGPEGVSHQVCLCLFLGI